MNPHALLRHLADGRFHSGEDLAAAFGVSRAAVWKQLKQLQTLPGITVHAVRGRGYRLASPLELLDAERLGEHLGEQGQHLADIELLPTVDSTNARLLARAAPGPGQGLACLTEHQTAGRGRRGRRWVSGFGRNLTLSLAWTFDVPMAQLSGLSLAAGTALANALAELEVSGLGLKWPNDLYLDGRKLAGLLVEASGEANGPSRAVIGVGINLCLDPASATAIDQPWADLTAQFGECAPRNRIAGTVLAHLVDGCRRYAREGLAPFLPDWRRYDLFQGREVQVRLGDRIVHGRYVGLNDDGSLLLDTAEGPRSFAGGEISLRPAVAS